jgi:hypothetical protein
VEEVEGNHVEIVAYYEGLIFLEWSQMFKVYFPRALGQVTTEQDRIQKIEPILISINAYNK